MTSRYAYENFLPLFCLATDMGCEIYSLWKEGLNDKSDNLDVYLVKGKENQGLETFIEGKVDTVDSNT